MSEKRKPIQHYSDGWYDPNTKTFALYGMWEEPKPRSGGGLCLLMTTTLLSVPVLAVVALAKGRR